MLRKLLMVGVVAFGTLAAAGSLAPAHAWVRGGWHAGWGGHGCCWRGRGWGWHAGWGWGHPAWGWGWGWRPGWHVAWGAAPGHWVWIRGRGWVWR